MSSIYRRLVIEDYGKGNYGVFIDEDDNMGLNKNDVSALVDEFLEGD